LDSKSHSGKQQLQIPIKQQVIMPASVVSPSLWKPCKPLGSSLQVAKTALRQMRKEYACPLQASRLNNVHKAPTCALETPQSLAEVVKISSLLP